MTTATSLPLSRKSIEFIFLVNGNSELAIILVTGASLYTFMNDFVNLYYTILILYISKYILYIIYFLYFFSLI